MQQVGNRSSALRGVHVTITRKSVGVEPDPDNLTASAKLILDALQRVGVIKDDSPQYISLKVQWERAKKRVEQETVVTIEKWDLSKVQDH